MLCFSLISFVNAGPARISCEYRKNRGSHVLISGDTAIDVIVLNPVDDSVCTLQCDVGWYEAEYGNAAPFLCEPKSANRESREGIPRYPINCAST